MTAGEGSTFGVRPPRAPHADAWALDPDLIFLNHGSFGACPRPVLAVQADLRAELEANPVAFLGRALEDRLDQARSRLAEFLGVDPADLAFVPSDPGPHRAPDAGVGGRPAGAIARGDAGQHGRHRAAAGSRIRCARPG